MTWVEVLVEGASDVPVVREVLIRRFGLVENTHFRIHPHKGKGELPLNPLARPDRQNLSLLHQLPAKLRGFGTYLTEPGQWVLVLVDVDDQPCHELLRALVTMYESLPVRPRVLFRLAIEETESWLIADADAVSAAYPDQFKRAVLKGIRPDQVVGAWEKLGSALGMEVKSIGPSSKFEWATHIAPHLDLQVPRSPSFRKFIEGIDRTLRQVVE